MKQYRIDKSYEKIYKYSKNNNAYIFCCSFFDLGVTKKTSEKKILEKLVDYLYFKEDL